MWGGIASRASQVAIVRQPESWNLLERGMAGFIKDLPEADCGHLCVDNKGGQHWIATQKGVPQDMPLSSYMFPLAIKAPVEKPQGAVDQLSGGGRVVAYPDDVYILARPSHIANIMQHAAGRFGQVGLGFKGTQVLFFISVYPPISLLRLCPPFPL